MRATEADAAEVARTTFEVQVRKCYSAGAATEPWGTI